MEIINEIKPKDDKEKQKFVHRSLADVQRVRLEKLMKNPVSLSQKTIKIVKSLVKIAGNFFRGCIKTRVAR
jgi:hypothetical protein